MLARDRRRGLVHAASGLAVSMALLLVAANVGRNQYLSSLRPASPRPATAAVIDTVDAVAARHGPDRARSWPPSSPSWPSWSASARSAGGCPERTAPSWLTGGPVHDTVAAHRRAFQWLVLVLGLVVLVLWNQPTVLVALIIVLVTLFVVMLVGLYGRTAPAAGRHHPATAGDGTRPPIRRLPVGPGRGPRGRRPGER